MLNMLCRATQLKHVGLIAGIGILYLDGATATRIPRYIGTIYQTSPSGSKKKGPPWCWCCIQATAFNIYQTLTDYWDCLIGALYMRCRPTMAAPGLPPGDNQLQVCPHGDTCCQGTCDVTTATPGHKGPPWAYRKRREMSSASGAQNPCLFFSPPPAPQQGILMIRVN